jgi:hypothetical protein
MVQAWQLLEHTGEQAPPTKLYPVLHIVHVPGVVHVWQLLEHIGEQAPLANEYPVLQVEHDVDVAQV